MQGCQPLLTKICSQGAKIMHFTSDKSVVRHKCIGKFNPRGVHNSVVFTDFASSKTQNSVVLQKNLVISISAW